MKKEAVEGLQFYFKTAWEATDLEWTKDNDREVEAIVDDILEELPTPCKT